MTLLKDAINDYISDVVSPYDIIHNLMPVYYPTSDIVLDAAEYFTTIIRRKDFCVEHTMLGKYGILSISKTGKIKSSDIISMLRQYQLVENVDYLIKRNVPLNSKRGRPEFEYILTPKAFFLCLVRSKNSFEYAKYYFHVLEIYDYYEEYYTAMYKEKISDLEDYTSELDNTILEKEDIIEIRDTTILEKEDSITCLKREMKEMMNKMDKDRLKSEKEHNDLMAKLDRESEKHDIRHIESITKLNKLQNTVDRITTKLDTCSRQMT